MFSRTLISFKKISFSLVDNFNQSESLFTEVFLNPPWNNFLDNILELDLRRRFLGILGFWNIHFKDEESTPIRRTATKRAQGRSNLNLDSIKYSLDTGVELCKNILDDSDQN